MWCEKQRIYLTICFILKYTNCKLTEGNDLEFCPECDTMLRIYKEKGKSVLKCRCGYNKNVDVDNQSEITPKQVETAKNSEIKGIEIIDDNIGTLPTKTEECEKCGNKTAYYWQVQTRSGDEAMTTFFRCTKCRFTWLEY